MNNDQIVKIYTKTGCPYCVMATNWFTKNKIKYIEMKLDNTQERQELYESIGEGVSTVPQIYIKDQRIGGYTDLIRQESYVRWLLGIEKIEN